MLNSRNNSSVYRQQTAQSIVQSPQPSSYYYETRQYHQKNLYQSPRNQGRQTLSRMVQQSGREVKQLDRAIENSSREVRQIEQLNRPIQNLSRDVKQSGRSLQTLSKAGSPSTAQMTSNLKIISNAKTIDYQGGDFYQGEVNEEGDPHGYGKYYFVNRKHQYHGQFEDGQPHGIGQLYKVIGNVNNLEQLKSMNRNRLFLVYDGQWRNGMRNGQGTYYYNSQNHYYHGPWVNDQRHGNEGTYVGPIGRYVGRWKNGQIDGKGEFFINRTGTTYVGNFANNQFVNGVMTYSNKDEYSGAVRNGLRDDNQGRYLYSRFSPNNEEVRYVGGWRSDKKNDQSGSATLTYPNGETLKGVYNNGNFIDSAQCMYQWGDGSAFKGWVKKNSNGYGLKGVIKQPNGKQYQV